MSSLLESDRCPPCVALASCFTLLDSGPGDSPGHQDPRAQQGTPNAGSDCHRDCAKGPTSRSPPAISWDPAALAPSACRTPPRPRRERCSHSRPPSNRCCPRLARPCFARKTAPHLRHRLNWLVLLSIRSQTLPPSPRLGGGAFCEANRRGGTGGNTGTEGSGAEPKRNRTDPELS